MKKTFTYMGFLFMAISIMTGIVTDNNMITAVPTSCGLFCLAVAGI